MKRAEETVVVYVSQGPLGAEVAKSKLESADIPVMLRFEAVGRALGITVDGLGRVDVLVPRGFEVKAKALLQETDTAE